MSATVMRAAAVISTIMPTFSMLMVVVVALDIGIITEIICKKCFDCRVASSSDTSIELDTCIGKCHLCATAYTSADENVSADDRQKSRKCSVSLTFGINYSF